MTFANMVYVMRKEFGSGKIEEVLRMLSLIFEFTELAPAAIFMAAPVSPA